MTKNDSSLKIDLGCGPNKKEGFKGMDILPLPGVDYIIDIENGFSFLADNSVDEFYSSHFLEHINNLELILGEIHRTLKPEGVCTVIVPHFSNPHFYSDYTHKRFFGLYSFDYFTSEATGYRRKLPNYNNSFQFKVIDRRIVFKSSEFYFTNLFRKHFLNRLFNASKYWQAVYEEYFVYIFPCFELKFIITAIK